MKKMILLLGLVLFSGLVLASDMLAVQSIDFEPGTVRLGEDLIVKISVRNISKEIVFSSAYLEGAVSDSGLWDGSIEPGETKEIIGDYTIEDLEPGSKSITVTFESGEGETVLGNNSKKGFFTVLEKKKELNIPDSNPLIAVLVALIVVTILTRKRK